MPGDCRGLPVLHGIPGHHPQGAVGIVRQRAEPRSAISPRPGVEEEQQGQVNVESEGSTGGAAGRWPCEMSKI